MTTTTVRQAIPLAHRPVVGAKVAFNATWASVKAFGRWMFGSGGLRGYHRERFPEHEMYLVIRGKRDKFEGF